jgi:aspartate aminotransferase-like enzyme
MTKKMEFLDLFIPGPVNISSDVREKLSLPIIGHREKEKMGGLHQDICDKFQKILFTKNQILLSTSSSTGLMEGAIRNCVKEKVLHVVIGAFGDRWHQISIDNEKLADKLEIPWGHAASAEQIEEKLSGEKYEAVCITHNETSTGVASPLKEVYKVIKEHECLFLVDAVSGAGGLEARIDDWQIDVYIFGLQKCFALPPGLAIASVSEAAFEKATIVKNRGWYFDFIRLKKYHDRGGMQPATPVIPVYYATQYQLDKIVNQEGIENRWTRHTELGNYTRQWVKNQGLELFAEEKVASNTVTCVKTEGININILKEELKKKGYLFAMGYGPVKEKVFRIAHMGDRTLEELKTYLNNIEEILEK